MKNIKSLFFSIALSTLALSNAMAEVVCTTVEVPIFKSVPRANVQKDIGSNPVTGTIFNFIIGGLIAPGSYSTFTNTSDQIIDMIQDYNNHNEIVGFKSEVQCHYLDEKE